MTINCEHNFTRGRVEFAMGVCMGIRIHRTRSFSYRLVQHVRNLFILSVSVRLLICKKDTEVVPPGHEGTSRIHDVFFARLVSSRWN